MRAVMDGTVITRPLSPGNKERWRASNGTGNSGPPLDEKNLNKESHYTIGTSKRQTISPKRTKKKKKDCPCKADAICILLFTPSARVVCSPDQRQSNLHLCNLLQIFFPTGQVVNNYDTRTKDRLLGLLGLMTEETKIGLTSLHFSS